MNLQLFLILFSTMYFSLLAESKADTEKVQWVYNYEKAIAKAKETGKPILLEFRCAP